MCWKWWKTNLGIKEGLDCEGPLTIRHLSFIWNAMRSPSKFLSKWVIWIEFCLGRIPLMGMSWRDQDKVRGKGQTLPGGQTAQGAGWKYRNGMTSGTILERRRSSKYTLHPLCFFTWPLADTVLDLIACVSVFSWHYKTQPIFPFILVSLYLCLMILPPQILWE